MKHTPCDNYFFTFHYFHSIKLCLHVTITFFFIFFNLYGWWYIICIFMWYHLSFHFVWVLDAMFSLGLRRNIELETCHSKLLIFFTLEYHCYIHIFCLFTCMGAFGTSNFWYFSILNNTYSCIGNFFQGPALLCQEWCNTHHWKYGLQTLSPRWH